MKAVYPNLTPLGLDYALILNSKGIVIGANLFSSNPVLIQNVIERASFLNTQGETFGTFAALPLANGYSSVAVFNKDLTFGDFENLIQGFSCDAPGFQKEDVSPHIQFSNELVIKRRATGNLGEEPVDSNASSLELALGEGQTNAASIPEKNISEKLLPLLLAQSIELQDALSFCYSLHRSLNEAPRSGISSVVVTQIASKTLGTPIVIPLEGFEKLFESKLAMLSQNANNYVKGNDASNTGSPESKTATKKAKNEQRNNVTSNKSKSQIEDVGAKIGGAKKDKYSTARITIEELEGLGFIERQKFLRVASLWPQSLTKSREQGLDPRVCHLVTQLRDLIYPVTRSSSTIIRRYFTEAEEVKYANSIYELREFFDEKLSAQELTDRIQSLDSNPELRDRIESAFKFTTKSERSFKKFCYLTPGFDPPERKDEKDFSKNILYPLMADSLDPYGYRLKPQRKFGSSHFISVGYTEHLTDQQVHSLWASLIKERAPNAGVSGADNDRKIPQRPYLEKLENNLWAGKNFTPIEADELLAAHNLRAIEFGNYVTQDERQFFLNETRDALGVLARIVGVNKSSLSHAGSLGLAFGARGSSQHLAHYEPAKKVFNLTKKKGAGSLAHEYWHSLDHFLALATMNTANSFNEYDLLSSLRIDERETHTSRLSFIQRFQSKCAQEFGTSDFKSISRLAENEFQNYEEAFRRIKISCLDPHYTALTKSFIKDYRQVLKTRPATIEDAAFNILERGVKRSHYSSFADQITQKKLIDLLSLLRIGDSIQREIQSLSSPYAAKKGDILSAPKALEAYENILKLKGLPSTVREDRFLHIAPSLVDSLVDSIKRETIELIKDAIAHDIDAQTTLELGPATLLLRFDDLISEITQRVLSVLPRDFDIVHQDAGRDIHKKMGDQVMSIAYSYLISAAFNNEPLIDVDQHRLKTLGKAIMENRMLCEVIMKTINASETATTYFMKNAQILDSGRSKAYWSTNVELTARAFECYIFDKMEEIGVQCDFLVHSVEDSKFCSVEYLADAYPASFERKMINEFLNKRIPDLACSMEYFQARNDLRAKILFSLKDIEEGTPDLLVTDGQMSHAEKKPMKIAV